ncbi:MAG TPA: hypothetical protein VFU23_00545 [Gemmatimonadales bacterium]|nr:hypothetical protein [Gemmatimonadales bacterium]
MGYFLCEAYTWFTMRQAPSTRERGHCSTTEGTNVPTRERRMEIPNGYCGVSW